MSRRAAGRARVHERRRRQRKAKYNSPRRRHENQKDAAEEVRRRKALATEEGPAVLPVPEVVDSSDLD